MSKRRLAPAKYRINGETYEFRFLVGRYWYLTKLSDGSRWKAFGAEIRSNMSLTPDV